MAPLQVILLLLVIRLPAILASAPDAASVGQALLTPPPGKTAAFVVASFIATHLLLAIFVRNRARRAVRQLNLPSTNGTEISHKMDHLLTWGRWASVGITAIHIFIMHLPAVINGWLNQTVLIKEIPMAAEAAYFIPPFLTWVSFWASNYSVEAANRERSFAYRLAQGLPAHPMPSLGRYLSMQIRHNFYLLALIGVASLIEAIGERADPYVPHVLGLSASQLSTGLAIITALIMVPWLITRIWTTVPLRGPLRQRLDAIAKQYHIGFRNVLVWKTHNHVTNAAILGPFRFCRYFLMTDSLLEQLTDQQIEAVFAHEIGHGVHRHILWYLGGIAGALTLTGGIAQLLEFYSPADIKHAVALYFGTADAMGLILLLAMMVFFMSVGLSFVSHRFEHQADWFAARHMTKFFEKKPESLPIPAVVLTQAPDPAEFSASIVDIEPLPPQTLTVEQYTAGEYPHATACSLPPASAKGPNIENAASVQATTSPAVMGTEVFISSLDSLIDLSHRSRHKRGWMHPSVNKRVALLRSLATDPKAVRRFRWRMFMTRVVIGLLLITGAAASVVASKVVPTPPSAGEQPPAQGATGDAAPWNI